MNTKLQTIATISNAKINENENNRKLLNAWVSIRNRASELRAWKDQNEAIEKMVSFLDSCIDPDNNEPGSATYEAAIECLSAIK